MKKIFSLLLSLLLCIVFVSAYPVAFNFNTDDGHFQGSVDHCTNGNCNVIDQHIATTSGNPNSFSLPNLGSGTQYFALYFYQECTAPHIYRTDVDEATGNGPWEYWIDFNKKSNCKSLIDSLAISSDEVYIGEPITVTTSVSSAFWFNQYVHTLPNPLRDDYDSTVKVKLKVNDVLIDQQDIDVVINEYEQVEFIYYPQTTGQKEIKIVTKLPDECKCSSTLTQYDTISLNVISECNDGIDNDGDGAIDYPDDFSCLSLEDNDETHPLAECQDGIDNDYDTFIDFPDDLGCLGRFL